MKILISSFFWQLVLLLLLFKKDAKSGEKELFKKQPWTATDIVVLILAINVFTFLQYFLLSQKVVFYSEYIFHIFLTFVLLFFLKFKKTNFKILGWKNLKKSIYIGFLAGTGIYILYLSIIFLINDLSLPLEELKENGEKLIRLNNSFKQVLYVIFTLVWGPFIEESIFKGILYSPYRKKYGITGAILITSIFFSVVHLQVSLNLVLGSIILGILYEKYESIIGPIVAHATHNTMVLLVSFFINF